jgi:hypothetical protein
VKSIVFTVFLRLQKRVWTSLDILIYIFDFLAMPWFGLDIGGTLTKLVYFEPTDSVSFSIVFFSIIGYTFLFQFSLRKLKLIRLFVDK